MRHRALLLACGISIFALPAHALAADASQLTVTIYNAQLALVQDSRTIDLTKGRQTLEFKDVSAAIEPQTVTLSAPGIAIVEQNFDYDLLTPSKLMEKAVGHQVQIVRTNPGNGQQVTETATVLSVNDGVVLKIGDRIEVLRDDDVPTRVIFDKVPDNLRARPTLSVTLDAAAAGPRPATLSYLTTGLSWKADYVALFDDKAGKLDLQGWITLTNESGTAFANANTQLVAGDVQVNGAGGDSDASAQAAGTETDTGPGHNVGDVHIYDLPEPTTIAQNQTKQVGFLQSDGVTAHKVYQYYTWGFHGLDNPEHAAVVIDFMNSRASGLAAGLPAGTIRVYERDAAGEPKFVGENSIGHTPQGSEFAVKIGDAFDVTVQPTVVSQDAAGTSEWRRLFRSRYSMSYLIRNAKAEPVTVELRQSGLGRDGKILKESLPSRRIDAYTVGWSVPVPANGQTVVTFDAEAGW